MEDQMKRAYTVQKGIYADISDNFYISDRKRKTNSVPKEEVE
jgi:hypothetical protein